MTYTIQLSKETLQILKNFASINPSLYVKPGNMIRSLKPSKAVLADAVVKETFESEFAVYNLHKLLSVLSLPAFSDPTLEISDSAIKVKSKDTYETVNFPLSDTSLVQPPPSKKIVLPTVDGQFVLNGKSLMQALKLTRILEVQNVAFERKDNSIYVMAMNSDRPGAESFSERVCHSDGPDFLAVFKSENISLLMDKEYEVSLCKAGHAMFSGDFITYVVAMEHDSRF